jgi:hypothetical protein
MKSDLARVLDPASLDASSGARARLRVRVEAAWLVEGAELSIDAPARLGCARCDGGGCDGCGRSGALRAPAEAEARALRVHVPAGDGRGLAVRLVRPFGPDAEVDQLVLELEGAPASDERVRRVPKPAPVAPIASSPVGGPGAALLVAMIVLGLVAALLAYAR